MFFANTIVVAAHRRSGMQWTIDALRKNSPRINDTFMDLEQLRSAHDAGVTLARFRRQLLGLEGRALVNLRALPAADGWKGLDERLFAGAILRNSPKIYSHRDGRDVVLALYYYMGSFSETVRKQSFSKFLHGEAVLDGEGSGLSVPGFWARHAETWLDQPNLLAIAYRELESDYAATVQKMAAFLDLELRPNLIPLETPGPARRPGRFDAILRGVGNLARRSSAAEQARMGLSGIWRRHYDKRDREFFMREAGVMLRELGYSR